MIFSIKNVTVFIHVIFKGFHIYIFNITITVKATWLPSYNRLPNSTYYIELVLQFSSSEINSKTSKKWPQLAQSKRGLHWLGGWGVGGGGV